VLFWAGNELAGAKAGTILTGEWHDSSRAPIQSKKPVAEQAEETNVVILARGSAA